jgi:hypothetical protein
MLLDGDSAKWLEGANNDVLSWVSEATTDVTNGV